MTTSNVLVIVQRVDFIKDCVQAAKKRVSYWKNRSKLIKANDDNSKKNKKDYNEVIQNSNARITSLNKDLKKYKILLNDFIIFNNIDSTGIATLSISRINNFHIHIINAPGYITIIKQINIFLNKFINSYSTLHATLIDFQILTHSQLSTILINIKKNFNSIIAHKYSLLGFRNNNRITNNNITTLKNVLFNEFVPHLKIFHKHLLHLFNKKYQKIFIAKSNKDVYNIILSYLFPSRTSSF